MLILDTKTETYTELQQGALMIGYLDISLQWNLSITDTIGTQHFFRESEVSLTQGLPVLFPAFLHFLVYCIIWLLSTICHLFTFGGGPLAGLLCSLIDTRLVRHAIRKT